MKKSVLWALALAIIVAAGPAHASKAMQMWRCGMEDGTSEEALEAHAAEWLKLARQIDGGENIEAHILFPVAVNAMGETDVMIVITMPSFADWGKFWDAYPSSDAAASEDGHVFCPDSVLWESVKID